MANASAPLRLLLLRHAKSAWDDPALEDRDRPLARRGVKAASAMGRMLQASGLAPAAILCSPAGRARQTCELVMGALASPPAPETREQLYDFGDGGALLDVIRSTQGGVSPLLVIGHNPALENLAFRLAAGGETELLKKLAEKFPTATLAVIEFRSPEWAGLPERSGILTHFIRPRDLPAD